MIASDASSGWSEREAVWRGAPAAITVFAGRILFAAIFVQAGITHFSPALAGYAAQAGVPFAQLLVPLSGLLAMAGGLSVAAGYRARLGAWMIIAFLVPVTLTLHAFWNAGDPAVAQMEFAMFMKNLGLLGGALLLTHFGAGPMSLDARRAGRPEAARRTTERPGWNR